MTLEEEFQGPVHDLLKKIVISDAKLPAWDIYPPKTDYYSWMGEQEKWMKEKVKEAHQAFDEIAHGVHGTISGKFPSPTPRKRKRVRNKR